MTPDQLELAITHYLDGSLPPEDLAALERRLADEPRARALLEEHRKLDALLRAEPVPALDWDDLAGDLQAVVTGTVDQEARAQDLKLNQFLRAAVTPVPEVRWDALASQISATIDREAAVRDEQDEALDRALRSLPVPSVNWDRLATHLSGVVAAQDEQRETAGERERVYSLKWIRRASQLAIAACVAIASFIGIRTYTSRGPTPPTVVAVDPAAPKPVTEIVIAPPEAATAPAVASIQIGPSESYVRTEEERELYGAGIASTRSPIVIALPAPADDGDETADRGYGFMFE